MKLAVRAARVPANPLLIARALAGEDGFAFLWTATHCAPSYVACWPSDFSAKLDPEPTLERRPSAHPFATAPRWIGLLPYECRRGLERPSHSKSSDPRHEPHVTEPLWCRYGAVVRVSDRVLVAGDDPEQVARLTALLERRSASTPRRARAAYVADIGPKEPDSVHRDRIRRAIELIVEGEIYQVNLARRFEFLLRAPTVDLAERFARRARSPFAFGFEHGGLQVAASSPELFLSLDARGRLATAPIKGTRPRGRDAPSDRAHAAELERDPKERGELAMVVDVERNDFGKIAKIGTVRVVGRPRVATFGSVHHRIATVTAELRDGLGRAEVLAATLPSGSVTGAPKIRAMEVIAELEPERRGLYTGAFGFLAHDGSLRLGMAIRTLTCRHEVAHYFAGGGIVLDSDPDREVRETHWKAAQLADLLAQSEGGVREVSAGQNFAGPLPEG